jgi:hypothetical protein
MTSPFTEDSSILNLLPLAIGDTVNQSIFTIDTPHESFQLHYLHHYLPAFWQRGSFGSIPVARTATVNVVIIVFRYTSQAAAISTAAHL